jgi:hypothetical protein
LISKFIIRQKQDALSNSLYDHVLKSFYRAMRDFDFRREGMLNLAALLRQSMEDEAMTTTELIARLETLGHSIKAPRVQRIKDGSNHEPPSALIWALARLNAELKFMLKPDGQPYTLEDLFMVAAGRLDPGIKKLSEQKSKTSEVNLYPQATALLKAQMVKMDRKPRWLAEQLGISVSEMQSIIRGHRRPSWQELLTLGSCLFEDRDASLLGRLYWEAKTSEPPQS